MSTSFNIHIIFGFKCDSPVSRDRKTGQPKYLVEWLVEHHPTLDQWNAGQSNGGSPTFFVGVELATVRDVSRACMPWAVVTPTALVPPAEAQEEIAAAFVALKDLDADLIDDDAAIGVYLIGDLA